MSFHREERRCQSARRATFASASTRRTLPALLLLAAAAIAPIANADPSLPWPGFKGSAAPKPPAPGTDDASKHLYVFGTPYSWQIPVVWNYNDTGRPASVTLDQVIAGINAATKQWTDVCQVTITRGSDTVTPPQNMDGSAPSPNENVLGWGDLTLGPAGNDNTAGITWTSGHGNAALYDFDMTLSTKYVVSTGQLARVAVHEWGHALGLAHSNLPGAVMSGPDNPNNPGVPDTPYNGVATLTDDDKHGCLCLYGPSDAMASQGFLCGLPSVAAMGDVPLGQTSSPVHVSALNASTTAALTITQVATSSPEIIKSGGCANGTTLGPGQSCGFDLTFRPLGSTGDRSTGYVGISTTNGVGTYGFPVTATATDAPPPVAILQLAPTILDFGEVHVGSASTAAVATVRNGGGSPLTIATIAPGGADPGEFARSGSCAAGVVLAGGETCTLQAVFTPAATGARNAAFSVSTSAGTQQLSLAGSGVAGVAATSEVVEYYNASLDHYFITASPLEISVLDTGTIAGWTRTGYTFHTYLAAHAGSSPVCRYYIPPAQGDSHFFSVLPSECNSIPTLFPTFEFEGANVMYMVVPDLTTGACPAGSLPVYRVWNQRPDSNHRYTIDRALRDAMVARGYVAEGYGPNAVGMCAPQ